MARVFIVHGWDGSPKDEWFVWLKKELKGHDVAIVKLPTPDHPKPKTWVAALKKAVKRPDRNTYFVGHSVGCQTILRYLATEHNEIGGVVLVAPWLSLKAAATPTAREKSIAEPWLEPFDLHVHGPVFALFSDNDPYVPLKNAALFRRLGAKVMMQKGKKHFSSHEDGIMRIPVVKSELLKMIKC